MKRYWVYIITAFITASLIGLVIVQTILIKQGYHIRSQLFNHAVMESMSRMALKIEQLEAYHYFNAPPQINQLYNEGINTQTQYVHVEELNGQYYAEIQVEDSTYSFQTSNRKQLDSLIKETGVFPDQNGMMPYNESDYFSKMNQFFQNMTADFLYGNPTPSFYIDSSELASIVNIELKRSGINTQYGFSLIDLYTSEPIFSSKKTSSFASQEDAYSVPILQDDFMGAQAVLLLDFPNKEAFIMQTNWQILLSSFVFILTIGLCFGASIFIIMKQKRLSELKTDFINNMTHELKTPVATISLASEMLSKKPVLDNHDRIQNYTSIISDENKRLGDHIEKVLQIAQLDRDEIKLKKEKVDIHELIQHTIDKFSLRFDQADAAIYTDLKADHSIVSGDASHLMHVFSNLFDNALKYRKTSKLNITISTKNASENILFQIKDNGIGMSSGHQKKIFTRFYRVPTGNIHNVKGFGLGLSYVKSIIEAHKGQIYVDSELNAYTTFTIHLPTISIHENN